MVSGYWCVSLAQIKMVREPVIVLNFFGNCACACHEKINKSRPKVIKYDSRPSNKILLN
jgi:hypothetical protein